MEQDPPNAALKEWSVYALSVLSPVIVILNLPIILSVVIFHKLHTKQDFLLANQAVCDLVVGAVSAPCLIALIHSDTSEIHFDKHTCVAVLAGYVMPHLTSWNNLLLLTLDRYVAVVHPFKYTDYSRSAALRAIYAVWAINLAWILVPFAWNTEHHSDNFCHIHNIYPKPYIFILILDLVACLVVPILLNARIGCVIYKVKTRMAHAIVHVVSKADCHRPSSAANKRSWQLTLVTYSLFFVFLAPHVTIGLLQAAHTSTSVVLYEAGLAASLLLISNSGLNALVFLFLKNNLRESTVLLLTFPPWRWRQLSHYSFDDVNTSSMVSGDTASMAKRRFTRNVMLA